MNPGPDELAMLMGRKARLLDEIQKTKRHPYVLLREDGFPDSLIDWWLTEDTELRRIFDAAGPKPEDKRKKTPPMSPYDFLDRQRRVWADSGLTDFMRKVVECLNPMKKEDRKFALELFNSRGFVACFPKETVNVNVVGEPAHKNLTSLTREELLAENERLDMEAAEHERKRLHAIAMNADHKANGSSNNGG